MVNNDIVHHSDSSVLIAADVDGHEALLTSRGHELFESNPNIEGLIKLYFVKALGQTVLGSEIDGIRKFFAEGSNSRIYTVSNTLLMKETNAHSMKMMLDRMSLITTAVETSVPRWVDVPYHYGLFRGAELPRQYVLMDKVESSVTVKHITQPDELSDIERAGVDKIFGPITDNERNEIAERYDIAQQLIHEALAKLLDINPVDVLSDWHRGNVLVQRLVTPVASSEFKLWVIDQ